MRLVEVKRRDLDDCFGSAANMKLSQDLRDMNFDRGDGDTQLMRDLLVLQAAAYHVEDA